MPRAPVDSALALTLRDLAPAAKILRVICSCFLLLQFISVTQTLFIVRYSSIKFQTAGTPDGLTMHCAGPFTQRHSDTYVFKRSGINRKIRDAQAGVPRGQRYCGYGDRAYPMSSYVHRSQGGAVDRAMNYVREYQ